MGENFQKSELPAFLQFVRVRAAHQLHVQGLKIEYWPFFISNGHNSLFRAPIHKGLLKKPYQFSLVTLMAFRENFICFMVNNTMKSTHKYVLGIC